MRIQFLYISFLTSFLIYLFIFYPLFFAPKYSQIVSYERTPNYQSKSDASLSYYNLFNIFSLIYNQLFWQYLNEFERKKKKKKLNKNPLLLVLLIISLRYLKLSINYNYKYIFNFFSLNFSILNLCFSYIFPFLFFSLFYLSNFLGVFYFWIYTGYHPGLSVLN